MKWFRWCGHNARVTLTTQQLQAFANAGMDDAEATSHTGTDHRLESARWVWTRVFGSSGPEPTEEELEEVLAAYQSGGANYW